jgi:hypothetical protein
MLVAIAIARIKNMLLVVALYSRITIWITTS